MKILFTSPVIEHPPVGGPQLRIENSIKALSKNYEIYLLVRSKNFGGERAHKFFKRFVKEIHFSPSVLRVIESAGLVRKLKSLRARISDWDLQSDKKALLRLVDEKKIDVVWFGYGNISYDLMKAVRLERPHLKMICDTDSVWSRFVLREAEHVTGERRNELIQAGKKKENEEKDWVSFCDVTTGVSQVDASYYASLTNDQKKVRVFSNVIDVANYKVKEEKPAGFKTPALFLAGSFGVAQGSMNLATDWVIDEVMPLVWKENPSVNLYVVGRNSDIAFGKKQSDRIIVTGQVESVLPYLCNSAVALVPLKFESGTRFKILEASACQIPIVSTTLGAEGIDVKNGYDIVIADSAQEFAHGIIELISNPAKAAEMGKRASDLVRSQFSVEAHALEGVSILNDLTKAAQ
jgi:glycosyltransferase involved in cell wall biosynthesis